MFEKTYMVKVMFPVSPTDGVPDKPIHGLYELWGRNHGNHTVGMA